MYWNKVFILISTLLVVSFARDNEPKIIQIVANSHYNLGYEFGRKTKEMVHARYAEDKKLNKKLIPFYNTPEGRDVFNHLYNVNNKRFPQYMDEIRGIADGAEVEFEKVFMSTLSEEFSDYVSKEFAYKPDESCSDIIVNQGSDLGICHNEDGNLIDFDRTSIIEVELIKGETKQVFYSYCYAGQLPTAAFGWNKHIAFTMNFLHTAKGDYDGIARNFIARYLMEADSLEDAWTRIVTTPHCVGHNYQVMDFATGETVDIEVAPFDRIGRFRPLPDMPHFHSNMYSLIMVDDTPSASSIHREARYKELQPPHSFKEAMAILGDEEDQIEPIYRNTTLNTAIVNFYKRRIEIYKGNPAKFNLIAQYVF